MGERGRLYVISAPSGAGKTSLVKALLGRRPQLHAAVSFTTRSPRATEVEGRDYYFVSPTGFDRLIEDDALLEHARVFDNQYGTGRAQVEAALAAGTDVILEIDWQGARQIRERLPESELIFILPPSRAALETRLRQRRTDPEAVIARRLADAAEDLRHWREFDYVVVNEDFEAAGRDLERIIARDGASLRRERPSLAPLIAALSA